MVNDVRNIEQEGPGIEHLRGLPSRINSAGGAVKQNQMWEFRIYKYNDVTAAPAQ